MCYKIAGSDNETDSKINTAATVTRDLKIYDVNLNNDIF